MAITPTNTLSPFWEGPFAHPDILRFGFRYLTLSDAGQFSLVCKAWNETMEAPDIWWTLSANMKIPRFEGRKSTAKEDLQYMVSHAISARDMGCLGKFVGEAPMISAKAFETLKNTMDCYESTKKLDVTFVFVVEPLAIYRDYDEALFKELIANGDFDEEAPENKNPQENGLLIPYSLKNVNILAGHPLFKKGEGPVFSFNDEFVSDILKQCSRISKAVKVTLMRKEVPRESRKLTYSGAVDYLKERGHVIVPLCTRVYYDVLEILNKDSCPDAMDSRWEWTSSRTLDEYNVGNDKYSAVIGSFSPGLGINLDGCPLDHTDSDCIIGAVPVFPEEDLAIGH